MMTVFIQNIVFIIVNKKEIKLSYEFVIKSCKSIESKLAILGANGKGLHEKLSSVEDLFDSSIISSIRKIATIRNRLVHEDGYELSKDDELEFEKLVYYVQESLDSIPTNKNIEKHESINKNRLTVCPMCGRAITPHLVFKNGVPSKSYCPHCCALIQDFNFSWFKQFAENISLAFRLRIFGKWPKIFFYTVLGLIALNLIMH